MSAPAVTPKFQQDLEAIVKKLEASATKGGDLETLLPKITAKIVKVRQKLLNIDEEWAKLTGTRNFEPDSLPLVQTMRKVWGSNLRCLFAIRDGLRLSYWFQKFLNGKASVDEVRGEVLKSEATLQFLNEPIEEHNGYQASILAKYRGVKQHILTTIDQPRAPAAPQPTASSTSAATVAATVLPAPRANPRQQLLPIDGPPIKAISGQNPNQRANLPPAAGASVPSATAAATVSSAPKQLPNTASTSSSSAPTATAALEKHHKATFAPATPAPTVPLSVRPSSKASLPPPAVVVAAASQPSSSALPKAGPTQSSGPAAAVAPVANKTILVLPKPPVAQFDQTHHQNISLNGYHANDTVPNWTTSSTVLARAQKFSEKLFNYKHPSDDLLDVSGLPDFYGVAYYECSWEKDVIRIIESSDGSGFKEIRTLQGDTNKNAQIASQTIQLYSGIEVGVACSQGISVSQMEDQHVVASGTVQFSNGPVSFDICAIFDGNNGRESAQFLKENFVPFFSQELAAAGDIRSAQSPESFGRSVIQKTFLYLDAVIKGKFIYSDVRYNDLIELLGFDIVKAEAFNTALIEVTKIQDLTQEAAIKLLSDSPHIQKAIPTWDERQKIIAEIVPSLMKNLGSSAAVLINIHGYLFTANLGKTRIFLKKGPQMIPCSEDSNIRNPDHIQSVVDRGGTKTAMGIVEALLLEMPHSFGYGSFKSKQSRYLISPIPEITSHDISEGPIMACIMSSGLSCASYNDAASVIGAASRQEDATRLVRGALGAKAKTSNRNFFNPACKANVTAMVATFK